MTYDPEQPALLDRFAHLMERDRPEPRPGTVVRLDPTLTLLDALEGEAA